MRRGSKTQFAKGKCEATIAVGALDPGVPYESRWAPYVRVHGPGQGQFPKGSIRPRGYMAPDARRSLARGNVAMMRGNHQRHEARAAPNAARRLRIGDRASQGCTKGTGRVERRCKA